MRASAYLHSLLFLLLLAGCAERLEMPSVIDGGSDRPGQTVADGTPIDVPFSVSYSPMTKSSLTVGEDAVNDINIVAFKNGVRTTFVYTTPDSDITLQLVKGESYNIYAVANVGAISIPSSEEDFLEYSYSVSNMSELGRGFPMSWKLEGFTAGVLTSPVDIELERLVAKISLTMPPGEVSGYRVLSARLYQAAKVIRPFADGGSKAESGDEVFYGDYSSPADLQTLNNGGCIFFYAFENAQGTLLSGNSDPWAKVPDNISDKEDVCTYIEITCEHDGSFLLEGRVTYRLYLGGDNCSNFDLLRNRNYNLILTTTYGGMNNDDFSWKVDVDCEIANAAGGEVAVGMHEVDDLYVGEVVYLNVFTTEEFDHFHGGEPYDCELVLVKNGVESDAAWFTALEDADYGSNYGCEMHCVSDVTGCDLYLKYDGRLLAKVPFGNNKRVNIQKPRALFSTQNSCSGQVIPASSARPTVNGRGSTLYAYLVDRQGYNLNCTQQYGFDLSLFSDLSCGLQTSDDSCSQVLDYCTQDKTDILQENGPCAGFSLSLTNPESEYERYGQLPHIWASLYSRQESGTAPFIYSLTSGSIAATAQIDGEFDIITPKFTWDFNEERLDVYNPSYIEILCEIYEVGKADDVHNNISQYRRVSAPGYYEKPLYIHRDFFLSNDDLESTSTSRDGSLVHRFSLSMDIPNGAYGSDNPSWFLVHTINGLSFVHEIDIIGEIPLAYGDFQPEIFHYADYDTPIYSRNAFSNLGEHYYLYRPAATSQLAPAAYGTKTYRSSSTLEAYGVRNVRLRDIVDMHSGATRPHARMSISYTSTGVTATLTSDPYGIGYLVGVSDGSVTGECRHRNYSTLSYTTDTHTIRFPFESPSYGGSANYHEYTDFGTTKKVLHSGGSVSLFSQSDITTAFQTLNVGCWHNSSEKAVAAAGNRVSAFTLPKSMSLTVIAQGETGLVPIDISVSGSTYSGTVQGTIYSSTQAGTYSLDRFGENNLDGTTRDRKNINSEVVVSSSNSTTTTSKSYTLTLSAADSSQGCYYVR